MRLWSSPFAALLLASCTAAYADTVYSLQNQAGQANVGTVTINSSAGTISGLDVPLTLNGTTITFSGTPTSQGYSPYTDEYTATFTDSGDEFQLNLPVSSLMSYMPADNGLCAAASFFCDYLANVYQGTPSAAGPSETFEGNLVAAPAASSVTPEPSSIALLGTGLLGLTGVLRRRFSRAS